MVIALTEEALVTWKGIQFFWQLDGPASTGIQPSPHSTDEKECAAAGLKQAHIAKYVNQILVSTE